jgi:hypothetical protein
MSGTHPSEASLQQYVLDRAACTQEDIGHIGSCADCQAAAAVYEMLAGVLKAQPAPAFNFDLTAAVIAQLDAPPRRKQKGGPALTAVLIALVIGVPAWLFRRSAYFVFTDMSADFYWVVLAAAAIVVGMFLLRLHKKYQDVINLINK